MPTATEAAIFRHEVYKVIKGLTEPREIVGITYEVANKLNLENNEDLKDRVQGALLILSKDGNIEGNKRYDPTSGGRKNIWSALKDPEPIVYEEEVPKPKKEKTPKPRPAEMQAASSAQDAMYVLETITYPRHKGITVLLKTAPVPLHNVLLLEVETPNGERVPMPVFDDIEALLTSEIPDFSEDNYVPIQGGWKLLCTVPVTEAQKYFPDIHRRPGRPSEDDTECVVIAIPVALEYIAVLSRLSEEDQRRYGK